MRLAHKQVRLSQREPHGPNITNFSMVLLLRVLICRMIRKISDGKILAYYIIWGYQKDK